MTSSPDPGVRSSVRSMPKTHGSTAPRPVITKSCGVDWNSLVRNPRAPTVETVLESLPEAFDRRDMFARRADAGAGSKAEIGLQYRTIRSSVVIPRPRDVVWQELEQGDHPAWTMPDSGGMNEHYLRGDGALRVGTVKIIGPIVTPPFGIRQVWWSEVTQVMPGWAITTETYTSVFDHMETLALHDHAEGTFARIEGSVRRVTTGEHADIAVGLMTRMADGHLRRRPMANRRPTTTHRRVPRTPLIGRNRPGNRAPRDNAQAGTPALLLRSTATTLVMATGPPREHRHRRPPVRV